MTDICESPSDRVAHKAGKGLRSSKSTRLTKTLSGGILAMRKNLKRTRGKSAGRRDYGKR